MYLMTFMTKTKKQNKTQNVKTIILPYLLEDLLTHLPSFAGQL